MKRILLKIILTIFIIYLVGFLDLIGRISIASQTGENISNTHLSVVTFFILYGGMFTAIRAIWKYNPEKSKNTDITLKKDDE